MTELSQTSLHDDDQSMRGVLEILLEQDEPITARAVARLHPTIRAASSITRVPARRQLLEEYQQRQNKLREWRSRTAKQGGLQSAKQLAMREQEVIELRLAVHTLTASHLAMIRAVGELGGFRKWAEFYETYRTVRDDLVRLEALDPSASVVSVPSKSPTK